MSHVSTHVLDTAQGRPARGVAVVLEHALGDPILATEVTDDYGRVAEVGPDPLEPGTYRLRFSTGAYFADLGLDGFYPEVCITFEVTEPGEHYHIPLLLSPFGYSTYRGS